MTKIKHIIFLIVVVFGTFLILDRFNFRVDKNGYFRGSFLINRGG